MLNSSIHKDEQLNMNCEERARLNKSW